VGSGGVEQRGHQVASGGRRRADGGERRADGVGVPARLDGLKAADLLALERRVDAQDRQLVGVVVAVAVDAHDEALPAVDLGSAG